MNFLSIQWVNIKHWSGSIQDEIPCWKLPKFSSLFLEVYFFSQHWGYVRYLFLIMHGQISWIVWLIIKSNPSCGTSHIAKQIFFMTMFLQYLTKWLHKPRSSSWISPGVKSRNSTVKGENKIYKIWASITWIRIM